MSELSRVEKKFENYLQADKEYRQAMKEKSLKEKAKGKKKEKNKKKEKKKKKKK